MRCSSISHLDFQRRSNLVIEINAPVSVNNKELVRNFRINLNRKEQQIKVEYDTSNPGPRHINLVLNYTKPKVSLPKAFISLEGQELESKKYFNARIEFNFLKMKLSGKGSFKEAGISRELSSISDVVDLLK